MSGQVEPEHTVGGAQLTGEVIPDFDRFEVTVQQQYRLRSLAGIGITHRGTGSHDELFHMRL